MTLYKAKKISYFLISFAICAALAFFVLPFSANAQSIQGGLDYFADAGVNGELRQYYEFGKYGNWFYLGGRNSFRGKTAKSREETRIIENALLHNDYILISTDYANVPIEDIKLFRETRTFWFSSHLYETDYGWGSGKVKVYVSKPSYLEYMERAKSHEYSSMVFDEIASSTVVIDEFFWDDIDLIGTEIPYINNMIPEGIESAYLQIKSPVDCKVVLLHGSMQRIYTLYVKRNEPLTVRILADCYHITAVSTQSISVAGEDMLPYNNNIQVDYGVATYENPYVVDLTDLVLKYNIKDDYIDGKPNYDIHKSKDAKDTFDDIPNEEQTVVVTPKLEEPQSKVKWWQVVLWGIFGSFILLGLIKLIKEIIQLKNGDDSEEGEDL